MSLKKILIGTFALLALMWSWGELLLMHDRQTERVDAASLSATSTATSSRAAVHASASALAGETKPSLTISGEVILPPVVFTKTGDQSPLTTTGEALISATLTIDGKSYLHQLGEKSSVSDLLKAAQAAGEITYSGKEYSGLGTLIVGINGKDNNAHKSNLYWIYSVNSKKATVGVSEYVLANGDIVSWSYEASI